MSEISERKRKDDDDDLYEAIVKRDSKVYDAIYEAVETGCREEGLTVPEQQNLEILAYAAGECALKVEETEEQVCAAIYQTLLEHVRGGWNELEIPQDAPLHAWASKATVKVMEVFAYLRPLEVLELYRNVRSRAN